MSEEAAEDSVERTGGDNSEMIVVGIVALAFIALMGWLYWPDRPITALGKCEAAIQERLKAPSTYKRVKSSCFSGTTCSIEYDAENSFGVPLRSSGSCSIDANETASWFEYPSASDLSR